MNVWIKYEHDLNLSMCGAKDSEVSIKLVLSNQEKSFIYRTFWRFFFKVNCELAILIHKIIHSFTVTRKSEKNI